jgi:pimeloyl-ACP methyl ester carboxylesterase
MTTRVRTILARLAHGALATVLGTVAAGLSIASIEKLGHLLYPPPAGLKPGDLDAIAAHVATAPVGSLLLVLLGWLCGAFLGGLLAARIAGRRPRLYAGVIAALVLLGAITNFAMIAHPAWFIALSIVALPLAGFAAATLADPVGRRGLTSPV